jgi:hypothetical protein
MDPLPAQLTSVVFLYMTGDTFWATERAIATEAERISASSRADGSKVPVKVLAAGVRDSCCDCTASPMFLPCVRSIGGVLSNLCVSLPVKCTCCVTRSGCCYPNRCTCSASHQPVPFTSQLLTDRLPGLDPQLAHQLVRKQQQNGFLAEDGSFIVDPREFGLRYAAIREGVPDELSAAVEELGNMCYGMACRSSASATADWATPCSCLCLSAAAVHEFTSAHHEEVILTMLGDMRSEPSL